MVTNNDRTININKAYIKKRKYILKLLYTIPFTVTLSRLKR